MTSLNIPGTEEYSNELNEEVNRVAKDLQNLEQMLTTGIVSDNVLADFRESVNRVRNTGWIIQKALREEKGVNPTEMLAQERVRCITLMATQLFEDLQEIEGDDLEGLESLEESIQDLMTAVRVRLA